MIRKRVAEAWRKWCWFWFESGGAPQMRLFRPFFGVMLFVFYLIRSIDLELYFSDKGMVPLADLRDIMPMDYRMTLLQYFPGTFALWAFDIVFLLSLLMLAFGILPRLSALVAFVIHVSFLHRNMSVAYGVDLISSFYLLFMTFADYRDAGPGMPPSADWRSSLGTVAWRLCQIQLCIIYAYSGLQKLEGHLWWNGDAVWATLANAQLARWDFSWVARFPVLVAIMTYATLVWEIYFPVLVWLRQTRYWTLFFGVIFHFGIAISINIPYFALLMVGSYAFFLEDDLARGLFRIFRFSAAAPQVVPATSDEMSV